MAEAIRAIGDHGIIGDMETAALVASDATLDYLCWPSLDSPSLFADLLSPGNGGAFSIRPVLERPRNLQVYLPETNVLMTRWMAEDGSAEVVDLMPHPEVQGAFRMNARSVVRRICVTRGEIEFTVVCDPRFDYAREVPVASLVDGGVRFAGRDLAVRLFASVPLECGAEGATARFTLKAGGHAWFVLGEDGLRSPANDAAVQANIDATARAWRGWLARGHYQGRWREQVTRSALTLKLLTSARHGSIAAAATFSLPEAVGAGRNWDYRAAWIRDSSFTVYAFMRLGFVEEAEKFHHWISDRANAACDAHPLQIMYALDGSQAAAEEELPHLSGYAGSRPVRIGNGAHEQIQLDIFGELMDSVYLYNKYGHAISHAGWGHVCKLIAYVVEHWQDPDAGIWEVRTEPRHFLHSRVMCWVAIDRAVRLAMQRSLAAPLDAWTGCRDAIKEDIWARFRHPEHGYFVQERDGTELDASLLLMPLVRFVAATDPVWLSTLDAIGEQLCDDGLVHRYRNDDGLDGEEGAFTTCTFWYAECLARAGRLDAAQLHIEKGILYGNSLGLFAEELDRRGVQVGNFPQALTHLAFISAAHFINRKLDPRERPLWQP